METVLCPKCREIHTKNTYQRCPITMLGSNGASPNNEPAFVGI